MASFNIVPEGCVAAIIAFTTPTDACRLALVSRDFMSASESDVVWERFLPSDCDHIVSRSDAGAALLAEFVNKKQLYMLLANQSLLIDRASKSFFLEKSSGKKCWMIAARSLSIAWGDTPAYWKWTPILESRFPEVAELRIVCWLDIGVKIQTSILSPNTQYAAFLVYNTTEDAYGLDNTFEASVNTAGGIITRRVYVDVAHQQSHARRRPYRLSRGLGVPVERVQGVNADELPKPRSDGWLEVKIGELFIHPGEEDDEVEVFLREVKNLNSKKGLIVQGIEFRPA